METPVKHLQILYQRTQCPIAACMRNNRAGKLGRVLPVCPRYRELLGLPSAPWHWMLMIRSRLPAGWCGPICCVCACIPDQHEVWVHFFSFFGAGLSQQRLAGCLVSRDVCIMHSQVSAAYCMK